jgi:hypothetical protein
MIAIGLCVLALIGAVLAGYRSLIAGIVAVVAVGFFYGIVRANVTSDASHFIFDAGLAGLYGVTFFSLLTPLRRHKMSAVLGWVICLIAYPTLIFFVPMQEWLVQLVGLRGWTFFLPCLLIGAMLEPEEIDVLALSLAVLTLVSFGFAVAEMILGVPRFYPFNAVTAIIYQSYSTDPGVLRIPATFPNSAAYGAVMVLSLPILFGGWVQERKPVWQRRLLLAALFCAMLGVFLCASRSQALIAIMVGAALILSGKLKVRNWIMWIALAGAAGWIIAREPVMQRFLTVNSTHVVMQRIGWSVNRSFFELAMKYPLGNGLGGGGTSMPFFLKGRVRNRVSIENEYGVLELEQGIPGLLLWMAFIGWIFTRAGPHPAERWYLGRWLARLTVAAFFATGMIGTGLLTSIPATMIMFVEIGWLVAPQMITRADLAEMAPEVVRSLMLAAGGSRFA